MSSNPTRFDEKFQQYDKDPGYEEWLAKKVGATLARVEQGETELVEHTDAMNRLRERLAARFGKVSA